MRKIKSVRDSIEMILIEHTKVKNNYMRNIAQKENIIDQTKTTLIDTNAIFEKIDGIKNIKNDLIQILNKYLFLKKQHINKISTLTKTIDTQKKQQTDQKKKHQSQVKIYEKTIEDLKNKREERR